MAMPRANIVDLVLKGHKGNLRRALDRDAKAPLAHREQLEEVFEETWQRRKECLADIKQNGMVIRVEKSNARGAIYETKIVNPAVKVLQTCNRELLQYAKALTAPPEPKEAAPEEKKDTFADFIGGDDEPATTTAPN